MAERGLVARRGAPSCPRSAMADTPTTPTETLNPAVAAFTARWAEFSKSFAIYPL